MSEQSLEVEILIEPFKGTLKDRKIQEFGGKRVFRESLLDAGPHEPTKRPVPA